MVKYFDKLRTRRIVNTYLQRDVKVGSILKQCNIVSVCKYHRGQGRDLVKVKDDDNKVNHGGRGVTCRRYTLI